jgi:hypothetical protein
MNDFKKGYQPRTKIVKDKKDDLFTDSHSSLTRWRNHFSQLLNVPGINDVRWTETRTATPTMPEWSDFELEMAIEKLKHKLPGFEQIPKELIKAESRTIHSEIHYLISSIWNKEELPEEWKELVMYMCSKDEKTDL